MCEHVDEQEEIRGPASRYGRYGVDVGLAVHANGSACRAHDALGTRETFLCRERIGIEPGDPQPDQCRLVRHDSDHGHVAAEPALDAGAADTRGNRYHERLLGLHCAGKRRADFFYELGFDGEYQGVGTRCGRVVVCLDAHVRQVSRQYPAALGKRFADPKLRRSRAVAQHPEYDRPAHIAAADEGANLARRRALH